jgi:hypothetical protein
MVVALVAGGWIVAVLGPKGAYAIGGVTSGVRGAIDAAAPVAAGTRGSPFLTWSSKSSLEGQLVVRQASGCNSTPSATRRS